MRYDVDCGSCHAELEVVVILEPAEAIEAGADPVREGLAEEVPVHCPKCGARIDMTLPPGAEDVEVRARQG